MPWAAPRSARGNYIEHLNHDVLRDFGGVMSPFTAWLMLRGIRTLHVRMPVHCSNAQKVAEFLAQHPKVERVNYPGLPGHPGHELAKRQMKAFGAMMSFEVKGGYEGGKRVMDRRKDIFPRRQPGRYPLADCAFRLHQPPGRAAGTAGGHRHHRRFGAPLGGNRSRRGLDPGPRSSVGRVIRCGCGVPRVDLLRRLAGGLSFRYGLSNGLDRAFRAYTQGR